MGNVDDITGVEGIVRQRHSQRLRHTLKFFRGSATASACIYLDADYYSAFI